MPISCFSKRGALTLGLPVTRAPPHAVSLESADNTDETNHMRLEGASRTEQPTWLSFHSDFCWEEAQFISVGAWVHLCLHCRWQTY